VALSQEVAIQANTTYVVSYHSNGFYSATGDFFNADVSSNNLHALSDALSGGNGVYAYGPSGVFPTYGFDTLVAKRLANPTDGTPTARGDTLYHIYCAVCHGTDGNSANATVGPRLAAPSLLTDRAAKYVDGYIYSMVRYGRGVMPMYGDKVTRPADRWAIVNYVRHLQAQAPAVNTGAPAGGN
jgi:mono/diheme cytochrome c family protein